MKDVLHSQGWLFSAEILRTMGERVSCFVDIRIPSLQSMKI